MSGKKVYDLAKEFGIQSKEFATMLQEINIPVKNHMSVITEQQEKYFRNNFDIVDNKVVSKSAAEKKKIEEASKPPAQHKPQQRIVNDQRPKADPQNQQRSSGGANAGEQRYRNPQDRDNTAPYNRSNQNRQYNDNNRGGYAPRQNADNQNRDANAPQRSNYQGNRPNNPSGGYRGNNISPNYQGSNPNPNYRGNNPNPNYRGNNPNPNYQGSNPNPNYRGNNPNPNYRGNNPQGTNAGVSSNYKGNNPRPYTPRNAGAGTWDKDKDNTSRPPMGQNRGVKKDAVGEKPPEKPIKIDKTKKENKIKTEARSKAKENFFSDEKPVRYSDNTKRTKGSKSSYKKKKQQEKDERGAITGIITIPEIITVGELAEKILVPAADIIKILITYGIMASINQSIDYETAAIVCEELNIETKLEEDEDIIEKILEKHYSDPSKLKARPPIITVMGHVDHGKTSLLDYIRDTNVISGEAGGITQHIGAYTINIHDNAITFIDTPGHAAFTAMRSRGASVTDIAVLVIAADDGIKPQTVEAINHAKAAEVPIVVAINKIDKPAANVDKVKQELTEYGLVAEDWGGTTVCVNVSAKTGEGIDKLLDMILLVAEVEDLKANYEERAVGTIIEARIDKQRGVTASLLVKSGVLKDGDIIVTGTIFGKVRAMTNEKAKRLTEAGPSTAVEVIGLSEVPEAGDKFFVAENEKEARKLTESRKDRIRIRALKSGTPFSLEELYEQISQGELKEVKLVIKADVQGSLEALKQSLEKLNVNEDGIRVVILHSGVGAVTETDVSLAAASKAVIIAFNVRADNNAKLLSVKEGIEIRYYTVIYNVLEEIEDAMKGMLDPVFKEVVTANAEIRQVFNLPNGNSIAGCYVTNGTITRKEKVRVIRDGIVLCDSTVSSLKRFKDDVKEVATGYECGIGIDKFNNLKENDQLEFYKMEEVARS